MHFTSWNAQPQRILRFNYQLYHSQMSEMLIWGLDIIEIHLHQQNKTPCRRFKYCFAFNGPHLNLY